MKVRRGIEYGTDCLDGPSFAKALVKSETMKNMVVTIGDFVADSSLFSSLMPSKGKKSKKQEIPGISLFFDIEFTETGLIAKVMLHMKFQCSVLSSILA